MEGRLIAWARAVKMQQRHAPRGPVLWLFSDPVRLADPLPVLRALPRSLPRGMLGVVLRPGEEGAGGGEWRALAAWCRARGVALAVAGDWRLAASLRAGLHLRGGRRPGTAPHRLPALTGSAHGVAELQRVRRAGALAFLSPAFATASHPGKPGLGPNRWGALARRGGACASTGACAGTGGVAALGGITAATVRRLPRCVAAGTIGALGAGKGALCLGRHSVSEMP